MVTSVPAGPDSGAWPGAAGACAPAAAAGGARAGGPTAAAPGGRPSVWQCPPPDRKITDLGEAGGEPQGLQLPDVVAGLLGFVDAAGVVAGAQVVVAGGGVGEQVPDDHQDGAGDGDQGLALAAALDQAPVALPEEGVAPATEGAGSGGRGNILFFSQCRISRVHPLSPVGSLVTGLYRVLLPARPKTSVQTGSGHRWRVSGLSGGWAAAVLLGLVAVWCRGGCREGSVSSGGRFSGWLSQSRCRLGR